MSIKVFGPYSPVKSAPSGSTIFFVAGQVGVDENGSAPESFEDQFELVIKNIGKVLSSQNLSLSNIINLRVYLTDMADFINLNQLFEKHFVGISPSRECVGVQALPPVAKNGVRLKVEISAVACDTI
jgi:2-iminobutanoate/2-iminopropanoate deaminase